MRSVRHAATWILEGMIRIAPAESRDWGRAMLNELPYVESAWAALFWALGGAVMLGKHMLLRRGQGIVPDGGFFAQNVSLRKVALLASIVYVLGALLFFAAPPFRQGLRVSLVPWKAVLHPAGEGSQAQINAIGKRAEARRDAEGLVFAAARLSSARESSRLADEAVRLNPTLVWVYAIVAVRHPEILAIQRWMPALEHWQPNNALFPLITAESIRRNARIPNSAPAEGDNTSTSGTAWQKAMAAAFNSPKFDDYIERLQALDHSVVQKYGFNNPQELWEGEQGGLPESYFSDARRYAISLLHSGDRLDAKGDWRGAETKDWCVARFGQVMDSQAHANYEHWAGSTLQWMAYQRLEAVAVKRGDTGEAALLAYLAKKFDPKTGDAAIALRNSVFGDYVARRNAFVLQLSALMMLVCSGLLVSGAALLFITSRARDIRDRKKRGATVVVTLSSAVGLLLSSATVYLTYRPYWYILQGDLLKGSARQSSGLRTFLAAIHTLPGFDRGLVLTLPVYFWASVILAAIAALMLIFLRHFREPPRLPETQPNSHVQ